MCQGGSAAAVTNQLRLINSRLPNDGEGRRGVKNAKTGEIQYLDESTRKHYKRVEKMRQKQADEMASQQRALIAQQQAESQRLQAQMVQQQQQQSKTVAGLQTQQAEKLAGLQQQQQDRISGIKSRGRSVVSSLQILGQGQQTAPTASQTAQTGGRRGASSTQANVARGSARSRGTNLSI